MDKYVTKGGAIYSVVADAGVREVEHDDDDCTGVDGVAYICDAEFQIGKDRGSRAGNLRVIAKTEPGNRGKEVLLDGEVGMVPASY
jgi:hypothetical protein